MGTGGKNYGTSLSDDLMIYGCKLECRPFALVGEQLQGNYHDIQQAQELGPGGWRL